MPGKYRLTWLASIITFLAAFNNPSQEREFMKLRVKTFVVISAMACANLMLLRAGEAAAQTDPRGLRAEKAAEVERRVALVVGNAAYKDSPLLNPVNDARAMASTLRSFGFDVIYGENLSLTDLKRNIRSFGDKIRNGGVGLFYFSGHGIQISGKNYLIPIGASITNEEEVEYEAVDLGLALAQMENARNRLNIVIIDACRNNPFARNFRSVKSGLASIEAPSGTLIAYATAPGSVASDGEGANGLFTQELLKSINSPELNIEQVFKQARINVRDKTQGKQIPWESSSLVGDFYFSTAKSEASATTSAPPVAQPRVDATPFELSFWDSVKSSSDPEDYKAYLEKYPNGNFVALARNKLRSLEANAKPANDIKNPGGEKATGEKAAGEKTVDVKTANSNAPTSAPDSTLPPEPYRLAQAHFQNGRYRDAAAIARQAYDADRTANAYGGLLAQSLLRLGQTQEAIEIYKRMLAANASNRNVQLLILPEYAEALVFGGQYNEATKALEPLLKNSPKDSPAYLNAVRISCEALSRSGKRNDAIKSLKEAIKGHDADKAVALIYDLASAYEETQQFDDAISSYEIALRVFVSADGNAAKDEQSKQGAGMILQRIAFAYNLAGRRDKMTETFERMKRVLGADNSRPYQLIIDTLLNEGKNNEALAEATSAVNQFPKERSFKLFRALAAARLGDSQTSNSILKAMLQNTAEDAEVYLYWAGLQMEANQLKEAEASARKAMELIPNDVGPLVTLATIQERQNRHKESEESLRKALQIDPDNSTALNDLGYFLANRDERLPEAEALLRRAVNIAPTNGSFLDSLGWLLFKRGKLQESQNYIEQAAVYAPRIAEIHDHLGDVYNKQGQTEKARLKWEEALRLATGEAAESIRRKLGRSN
jgi:tetratricopeptide (TPR) repeat protein